MPSLKLTKTAIDTVPTPERDTVYWDADMPGFGLKVTPRGRKVFVVLYRLGGAGGRLRKYTIGPYGRVTLANARAEALQVLAARANGRDPASEKKERTRRVHGNRLDTAVQTFIEKRLKGIRTGHTVANIFRREIIPAWGSRTLQEIKTRDVIELVDGVIARGTPIAANLLLKWTKTFFKWCVGQGLLDRSPAENVPPPAREVARERVLTDDELGKVIRAARELGGARGGFVELLALTAQRRKEVAGMAWSELDLERGLWTLPGARTKNGRVHVVHLSGRAKAIIDAQQRLGPYVFSATGKRPLDDFGNIKRKIDEISGVTDWRLHDLRRTCVSGMAALGVAPHVADKIINHTGGTISGVAAVYQRHEFMAERKAAMEVWEGHVAGLLVSPR